ncbi:MAG: MBL fold metallo-hydrolase RNA specificity domain-containing protein, partial [Anaerolineae bacterium]
HASREELKLLLRLLAPRYFVPIGGEYRMLVLHSQLATELGMPPEDVRVIENGQVLEFDGRNMTLADEVPGGYVYVDGLGVGDIGNVVLRDRHHLARDGFVVVVVSINRRTGDLVGEPELLTRGFVYEPESGDLLTAMRDRVAGLVAETHGAPDVLSDRLRDDLGQFVYANTKRRPMVMPLIVEV